MRPKFNDLPSNNFSYDINFFFKRIQKDQFNFSAQLKAPCFVNAPKNENLHEA